MQQKELEDRIKKLETDVWTLKQAVKDVRRTAATVLLSILSNLPESNTKDELVKKVAPWK